MRTSDPKTQGQIEILQEQSRDLVIDGDVDGRRLLIGIGRRRRAVRRGVSFDRSGFMTRGVSERQIHGILASGPRCDLLNVSRS
jgi:hypothetical protein